jgi:multisubunit Na+/H+ antiporter MnhB subunit
MTGLLTSMVARLLLPASLVTALAILVKSYGDAGDGFAAGAVAAAGIVVQYVAFGGATVERLLPVRAAHGCVVVGLLIALAVGFGPVAAGLPLLAHLPPPDVPVVRVGTLELHTAVVFDVGVFLLVIGFTVGAVRALAHAGGRSPS